MEKELFFILIKKHKRTQTVPNEVVFFVIYNPVVG